MNVSKGRREKHKTNLRKAILDSSLQIILNEGLQSFTIRRVAEAIEYSVPTIYEFFENKEAILKELQILWAKESLDLIQGIQALELSPKESLLKCAEKYCAHADANPNIYKAISRIEDSAVQNAADPQFAAMRAIIREWFQKLFKDNKKSKTDPDDAVDIFRSVLHGFISIHLGNRLQGNTERYKKLIQETLESLMVAWQK